MGNEVRTTLFELPLSPLNVWLLADPCIRALAVRGSGILGPIIAFCSLTALDRQCMELSEVSIRLCSPASCDQ